jgi:hypothetical protein
MRSSKDMPRQILELGRVPKPVTAEWLAMAYGKGMLRKDQLEDGKYYLGDCRNASVARWHAGKDAFTYMRHKFGDVFPEDISYPTDDPDFDVFTPFQVVEPEDDEKVVS